MKPLALLTLCAVASCSAAPPVEPHRPLASTRPPNALTKPPATDRSGTGAVLPDPSRKLSATKPLQIDPSQRMEVRQVIVDLNSPEGRRPLIPYLIFEDEWVLVKKEELSPTAHRYHFVRTGSLGDALSGRDPFQPRGSSPPRR